MALRGGFLISRSDCIRTVTHGHTGVLERPISALDLKALNAVQATPWRINGWVLDVMSEAWRQACSNGLRIGGVELGHLLTLPERRSDDEWEAMTDEDRHKYLLERTDIHAKNAGVEGRSSAIMDALAVAQLLRNRPAIWYPHAKDFRGRIYPQATTGPHPQGSDVAKSLIHFAHGMPLGPDGLFWLCVRAANTYGHDKLPLEERVAWTLGQQTNIATTVRSPLNSAWWTEAAEPWCFLATCYELDAALSSSEAEAFVSHLPIPLDGSCNGIQHLAAMGLDPIAAKAVNMTPDPERQDIYQEVADRVAVLVATDATNGTASATWQDATVSRSTVKRAVMTTPYGVTARGIQDQLIDDGLVPECDDKRAAAAYMRDKIIAALEDTIGPAKAVMTWLQSTADHLARAGLPFDWTTPTGSKVRQAYHVTNRREIRTLEGRAILFEEERKGGLNGRKQQLGAAPNFIHSFDAAHLSLTVSAAHDTGMRSFAMIHDSFGTHAANTTELGVILRQTFVDIYRHDWLTKVRDEVAGYAPHVKLDDPPKRGSFDIGQVVDAPYFFS